MIITLRTAKVLKMPPGRLLGFSSSFLTPLQCLVVYFCAIPGYRMT